MNGQKVTGIIVLMLVRWTFGIGMNWQFFFWSLTLDNTHFCTTNTCFIYFTISFWYLKWRWELHTLPEVYITDWTLQVVKQINVMVMIDLESLNIIFVFSSFINNLALWKILETTNQNCTSLASLSCRVINFQKYVPYRKKTFPFNLSFWFDMTDVFQHLLSNCRFCSCLQISPFKFWLSLFL